jgi:hypothetical protein
MQGMLNVVLHDFNIDSIKMMKRLEVVETISVMDQTLRKNPGCMIAARGFVCHH